MSRPYGLQDKVDDSQIVDMYLILLIADIKSPRQPVLVGSGHWHQISQVQRDGTVHSSSPTTVWSGCT